MQMFKIKDLFKIKDQIILTNLRPNGDVHCDRCGRYLGGKNYGMVKYILGRDSHYITRYFLCDVCHSECQKMIDAFVTKENEE